MRKFLTKTNLVLSGLVAVVFLSILIANSQVTSQQEKLKGASDEITNVTQSEDNISQENEKSVPLSTVDKPTEVSSSVEVEKEVTENKEPVKKEPVKDQKTTPSSETQDTTSNTDKVPAEKITPVAPSQPKNEKPVVKKPSAPTPSQPKTEKPVTKPVEKPVEKPVTKPVEKPVEKPVVKPAPPKEEPKKGLPPVPAGNTSLMNQILVLINKERAAVGLSALQVDTRVQGLALIKAKDMADNNYFSHTSPTLGDYYDMIVMAGISVRGAAENLTSGYSTAETIVQAWMSSPGHRDNILTPEYTHTGVGSYSGGEYGIYHVQIFITK